MNTEAYESKGSHSLRLRGADPNRWSRVPEVWLILTLIGSAMAGSLALVATALHHRDELVVAHRPIASPLPPADDATP